MADPLSVAASIAGLISITVEAVKFLSPYISAAKDTPQIAAHVHAEVQSTHVILIGLQNLTNNLESTNNAALIGVDKVVAIFTDGVLLYSELTKELLSLTRTEEATKTAPLIDRLQWAWKESTFVALLGRLQSFKSSMSLVLIILQSDSDQSAKQHQEQLSTNVQALMESNHALSRRLMNIEDALDAQTIVPKRMSFPSLHELEASQTQESEPEAATSSRMPIAPFNIEFNIGTLRHGFQDDLDASRVYRRARRDSAAYSFRSSIARSHNWTVFSGLSLGDISNMGVIALPIFQHDLTNAQHYDFGGDSTLPHDSPPTEMGKALLIECLEIKLKMLQIPGMQKYFDYIPEPPDEFIHIWVVIRQISPLIVLLRALDPTMDIDLAEHTSTNDEERLALFATNYCHDKFGTERKSLFTVGDLLEGDASEFLGVIKFLSFITKNLEISGHNQNALLSALSKVSNSPTELQRLISAQGHFFGDLEELSELEFQLASYPLNWDKRRFYTNLRKLVNSHTNLLARMERNLFLASIERRLGPVFNDLLDSIDDEIILTTEDMGAKAEIRSWLKGQHVESQVQKELLSARCSRSMPAPNPRISAYYFFLECLKKQPVISDAQKQDIDSAQCALQKAATRLEDNTKHIEAQHVIENLERRVRGSGTFGNLILYDIVHVNLASHPKPIKAFCYLFEDILVFCGEAQNGLQRRKGFDQETKIAPDPLQESVVYIWEWFYLRDILLINEASDPDLYKCELYWLRTGLRTGGLMALSVWITFATEPQKELWAKKIDEHRVRELSGEWFSYSMGAGAILYIIIIGLFDFIL